MPTRGWAAWDLRVITFEAFRALALALPDTEEGLSYGTPAFRVRGKLIARLREDGEQLVLKVTLAERAALLAQDPVTFSVTPHYENSSYVLVRLATVDDQQLSELLIDA